jgi:hypothetical protein
MLLQERIKREPEPAFGETARAAMTARTIVRKHPGHRFAVVEILGVNLPAGERGKYGESETERESMPSRPRVQLGRHP